MGKLLSCIEKTLEQQRKLQADLQRLSHQVAILQDSYTDTLLKINELKAQGNDFKKASFPTFTEWFLKYGKYKREDRIPECGRFLIEKSDVVQWLKVCGLNKYI